jgi:hypothetical protein
MAIASYDLGDLIELKITFRNDAGAVTDPTSPTLAIHKPDGTTTTYVHPTDAALVKDSTGVYHVNYSPTMAGTHHWRGLGTGAVQAEEQAAFFVRPNA